MDTIKRAPRSEPYFSMCRATAQNKTLSYEAEGMLSYLLSLPNDWEIRPSTLERKGCGRDKVYSILGELIENRYIKRTQNTEKGKFSGFDYTVYETPYPEKPDTDSSDTENTDTYIIDSSTEEIKTEKPLRAKKQRVSKPKEKPEPVPIDPPMPLDILKDIDSNRVLEGLKPFLPGQPYSVLNTLARVLCGLPTNWQKQPINPHTIYTLRWQDVLDFVHHWCVVKNMTLSPAPPSFVFNLSDWWNKSGRGKETPHSTPLNTITPSQALEAALAERSR